MSRGKSITKLLLDSSQAALFAGVEIHNKPHIAYRYPTAVILVINAWELALKAYVYKYIGKKRIYEDDAIHTISFSKAAILTRDHINTIKKNKEFEATFNNLVLLNNYRCSNIHFIDSKLDPVIFMLISKAVLNYDVFLKEYFKKDITKDDNLIVLPVGLKLPLDPIDYLKQNYEKAHNVFVNEVISTIRKLREKSVHDSIVVGFDMLTAGVKKISNADIVAAIDQNNGEIKLMKSIRITDDPNAPAMRIEPDLLPLTYVEIQKRIKDQRADIKMNLTFNNIMSEIKEDTSLCQIRYLDPKQKTGTKKCFYSEKAVDVIIYKYDKLQEVTQ
jgi:hypothetical protein